MSSSPILSSSNAGGGDRPFVGMLDVPCRVEVIVGTGSITVRECLQLQRDSVIRLEQAAGADLALLVEGVPAAAGEIVVDDDTTSVRISAILPTPSAEARA
jgi:flagellar motor switch protein FliN/FliY